MNRLAGIVGIVVCLSVTPTLAGPTDDVRELIEQGKKALAERKLDEAVKHYSAAIAGDSRCVRPP